MSKLLIALTCLLTFQLSHAQSFKVVKIAGKKAIVEVDDPKMINVNQTYTVGGGDAMMGSVSYGGGGSYKRDNAIAFNFSYTSVNSVSVMQLSGNYLWNLKQYEFGPLVGLTNVSGSGSSTNSTTFGGIGFYNFNENKPGVPTVLSAIAQIAISSGSGNSTTQIQAGGNYRWFLLSGDHCFSGSLLYQLNQASGNNTSGFALTGGIITYF